jgi:bacterioferritin
MPVSLAEYRMDLPYPALTVQRKNAAYARLILSNVGDVTSETTSVALYLYDSVVTMGNEDVSLAFSQVMRTEAHHLELFSRCALLLGADPRLWSASAQPPLQYWTPAKLPYTPVFRQLLQNALALEQATIAKYERQLLQIADPGVQALLRRVLLDETMHAELFRQLMG